MTDHTRETVEQLRSDIDSGRTGDKVPASDPAAAPLGADEEAAGTPVSADAVALARARENRARRCLRNEAARVMPGSCSR
jgi:hypothetical protein